MVILPLASEGVSESEGSREETIGEEHKSKGIVPKYSALASFNPQKRYPLDAVVVKAGKPNFVNVYLQEGVIKENVRLDGTNNCLVLI